MGPSNVTMPAVPDAACYQLAMECCVARGRTDKALSLLSEMEGRGLSPNEAGLRALIRGFASESGTPGVGGAGIEAESAELKWRGVERALGVFEELAERFQRPSRRVCCMCNTHSPFFSKYGIWRCLMFMLMVIVIPSFFVLTPCSGYWRAHGVPHNSTRAAMLQLYYLRKHIFAYGCCTWTVDLVYVGVKGSSEGMARLFYLP